MCPMGRQEVTRQSPALSGVWDGRRENKPCESKKSNLAVVLGEEMGWFLLVFSALPCAWGLNEMGARAGLALGGTKKLLLPMAA